jgi:hypothetical protein
MEIVLGLSGIGLAAVLILGLLGVGTTRLRSARRPNK